MAAKQRKPQQQELRNELEHIENLEQQLIQHIRTSGVRKPRENALIDETMDIRKARRKLFAAMLQQLDSVESRLVISEQEFTTAQASISTERAVLQAKAATLEQEIASIHANREQEKLKDLSMQLERCKLEEKQTIDRIRKKCEARIKQVEEKFSEVLEQKRRGDIRDARAIALDLMEKAKGEIERKYNEKLTQYKHSLSAISGREQDLQGSVQRYKELTETFGLENSQLKRKLNETEERLVVSELRGKDREISMQTLEGKITALTAENNNLRRKLDSQESNHVQSLEAFEKGHAIQLARVDEKIRRVVEAKDTEIQRLRIQLAKSESRNKVTDDMLKQLNKEFVPVKKRQA